MNKIDLIKTLSITTDISKIEATKIVNLFFEQMAAALGKDDRIEIRGLCCFQEALCKGLSRVYRSDSEDWRDGRDCAKEIAVF